MFRHYLILIVSSAIVSVFSQLLSLPEGSMCKDGDARGVCVHIYKCQNAHFFLKTKQYPPICSFDGKEPIVCCTDCNIVDDIRKIVFNPGAGLLPLTGQKANDKCVDYVNELDYPCKATGSFTRKLDPTVDCYRLRSEGGSNSKRPPRTDFYLALLGYGGDKNTAQWKCAGTIISENFVLTAAHCLVREGLGPVKYIAVGVSNRLDPTGWQKYDVKGVFPHPEYQTGLKYHDIALIKTDTIKFSRQVLPACLHSDPETNGTDVGGVLVWNPTGEDQGKMKVFPTYEFNEVQCSFYYPPHDELPIGFDASSQNCYGDVEKPEDSCQSDSGSPLLLYRRRAFHCTRLVVGVMSIDRSCGTTSSSGLYTKVIHYVPWIESIVWP
ncbi:serine protease snake-like [Spodoptera frugiperda]|uniref:Serine protease snake-like n=1 Tax=Spodoptera frugiperda TaxID=7108 RepID=A0A9R0E7L4_SPOFR|nr:serine protease snake-like [Spodoptera frugiperda]